jgi:hypothetical protein
MPYVAKPSEVSFNIERVMHPLLRERVILTPIFL